MFKYAGTINAFLTHSGNNRDMEDRVVQGLTITAVAVAGGVLTLIAALSWRWYLRRLRRTGWEAYENEDYEETERRLQSAMRVAKTYGRKSGVMARGQYDLATFYHARERFEEAATLCEGAVACAEGAEDARDPLTIAARTLLARLYFKLDRLTAAENTCRRVLEDAIAAHGEDVSATADIIWLLGNILNSRGKSEDGAALFAKALDIWEGDFEQDPEDLASLFENYAGFLKGLGRGDDAGRAMDRADALTSRSVN